MIIEITKRQIFIAASTIVTVLITFFSGYFLGYHNGTNDTINKSENKKGDGINFYSEEIEGGIIYHSTPNCEAIRNGVTENRAYTDSTYRMDYSTFCPKCMDEGLIKACQIFLEEFSNENPNRTLRQLMQVNEQRR